MKKIQNAIHLAERFLQKDKVALSRIITIAESSHPAHLEQSREIFSIIEENKAIGKEMDCIRLGICGSPGAGKSTFIEAFGSYLCELGLNVGVIAIDPSSVVTGGSLLGDRTRMENLSHFPNAFIRSCPSKATLGGLSPNTYDVVNILEFFGFDIVIVETVGTGQSETLIDDLSDIVLHIVPPGGGDDLQGMKRGILEITDILLVNKCDGELMNLAKKTKGDYERAFSLLTHRYEFWDNPVRTVTSLLDHGIDDSVKAVWDEVQHCEGILKTNKNEATVEENEFIAKRKRQKEKWIWKQVNEDIVRMLFKVDTLDQIKKQVVDDTFSVRTAAERILQKYMELYSVDLDSFHTEKKLPGDDF